MNMIKWDNGSRKAVIRRAEELRPQGKRISALWFLCLKRGCCSINWKEE